MPKDRLPPRQIQPALSDVARPRLRSAPSEEQAGASIRGSANAGPSPRDRSPTVTSKQRLRISHACEPCRWHKRKCDGGRPVCGRCSKLDIGCYYADGKGEKTKRDIQNLAGTAKAYKDLLLELLPQLDNAAQLAVQETLASHERHDNHPLSGGNPGFQDPSRADEAEGSGSAGSPRFQDRVQKDPAVSGRPIGFLGKSATIMWMEEIAQKVLAEKPQASSKFFDVLKTLDQTDSPNEFPRLLGASCIYYLDSLDLNDFGECGENVDGFQLPPRPVADALLDSYLATMHPVFPVINEDELREQYCRFWATGSPLTEDILVWIAILNIIFGLGELFAQSLQTQWKGKPNDHILYYVRSRLVTEDSFRTADGTDLDRVRLGALTGMYFLASNQMNRAWNSVGGAIRQAYTLGIHLKNADMTVTEAQLEMEMRTWHSLASLETQLCWLTGRPRSIPDGAVSTGLPKPIKVHGITGAFSEYLERSGVSPPHSTSKVPSIAPDSPSNDSMDVFQPTIELDAILSDTLWNLYSARTTSLRWVEVQRLEEHMNSRLAKWSRLWTPSPKDILTAKPDQSFQARSQRMNLQIRRYSVTILINRPCLCDADGGIITAMPDQSAQSRRSDEIAATQCVAAAQNLVKLLKRESDIFNLYLSTPWWSILHYIAQAATILLTEIIFDAVHVPGQMANLVTDTVMVLQWLQAMAVTNTSARLTWIALSRLLQLALAKNDQDIGPLAAFMPQDLALKSPGYFFG